MNNFFKYLTNVTNAIAGATKSVPIDHGSYGGFENQLDSRNLNTYKSSLYVYIGVSMIARRVAGIPFNYYKVLNTKGEVEEVLDHEVIDMVENPNSYLTHKELLELCVMFYLLSGDVFLYLERTVKGGRVFMHPLRPNDVEVVLNASSTEIIGYKYSAHGVTALFLPENVVHIKNIDPTNIIRGVGMLSPASTRISTETEATNYQSNFFKNQGRPDVAVFVDQELNQTQMDEGRARWKEVYGRGQGGQAGFFGKNVREVKALTTTPREMDYIATQKFLRNDILAALHIPESMVTSENVNLANAEAGYKMYMQEAVLPIVDSIKDAFNNRLLPLFDDTLFVSYDNPVPEDRVIKLAEATQLKKAGIITPNEARDMYGYETLDGSDELATESAPAMQALMYEARGVLRKRKVLRKTLIAKEKCVTALLAVRKASVSVHKPLGASLFPTAEGKKAYAAAYNKMVDQKAAKLEVEVAKYFEGVYQRVLANSTQAFSADGFMDKVHEQSIIKATLVPELVKILRKAGQEAMDALYSGKKANVAGEEFVLSEFLLKIYADRVTEFTNSIVNTEYDTIKDVIMEGLSAGDGVDTIGRALRVKFDDMKVSKGKQIARTETGFAQSLATQEAYKQSSIVTGKEWVTAGDANVRDEHVANEAQGVVGKNEAFSNGEEYPADGSINCRCVLIPALGEV